MRLQNEDRKGLAGSIVVHLVLALILFLWRVSVSTSEPEFIEVSLGATAVQVSAAKLVHPSPRRAKAAAEHRLPEPRKMDLPEKRTDLPDEILPVPIAKKLATDERPAFERRLATPADHKAEGSGLGQKEKVSQPGDGNEIGDIPVPGTSGALQSSVGDAVSASIQWHGGGTRRKISGELPSYPAGVNVETQIRIEATVMPDGTVRGLKPVQKGNTKLEEEAMKRVRLWMFEPLKRSAPQLDQTCVITFNYRLQ